MFFSKPALRPHGLEKPFDEIYLLALQEAMEHINATCRYYHPEEFLDVLPKEEFELIQDNGGQTVHSVQIRGGVSITKALDSMFHDIESDVGEGLKIIDCSVATCLVAAQAARFVYGDENFNAIIDEERGGRAQPIILRSANPLLLKNYFFDKFGVAINGSQSANAPDQRTEARFGYMWQPNPEAYSDKHDYLTSRGFHHIVLPGGSVLAFCPDVGGKFKDLNALARYMVQEMNNDLSIQEWCNYIKELSGKLSENNITPHTISVDAILNLATTKLNLFIETINVMSEIASISPDNVINEDKIDYCMQYFAQLNIAIHSNDLDYILSLCISLKTHILPKNEIKVDACSETYAKMERQASSLSSVFNFSQFTANHHSHTQRNLTRATTSELSF